MLFKKKQTINLTKLYFACEKGDNTQVFIDLIELCFIESELKSIICSLNYSNDCKYSELTRALIGKKVQDVENILITDNEQEPIFSINSQYSDEEDGHLLYKLTFIKKFDLSFSLEKKFFNSLAGAINLLYGYSRILLNSYHPFTEQKIKKSIFGSVGISVTNDANLWIIHPKELLKGAARGLYPLNYLTKSTYEKLCGIFKGMPEIEGKEIDLLELNDEQQKTILSDNLNLSNYCHFTEK